MAILRDNQIWVGVEQRLDGHHLSYSWPQPYVTIDAIDKDKLQITAKTAKRLAKELNRFARMIDPPKKRA